VSTHLYHRQRLSREHLLDIAAHQRTQSWLDELHGLIKQRADALAGRISGAATSGVGDTTDFLLLLMCNRYEPLLAQLRQTSPLHPVHLYYEMLKLAGECATFGRENRRVPELPIYKHVALAECFEPVVEEIRRAMTAVLDQTAVRIPLRDIGKGVFRADVPDPRLITSGFFVLAATSQLPIERLRTAIPAQVKIGPTEKLRDLVMLNLPGIKLEVLQYPPRQIPFHANFSYFQLEASNPLWQPIEISRAMGLYVAGDPPGLEMQLWAIRT
jgi:type VI secretion system protein ImpJ